MEGYFPVFIPLKGQPVLLVGGGKVALRRAEVLSRFGAELTVVAPESCRHSGRSSGGFPALSGRKTSGRGTGW